MENNETSHVGMTVRIERQLMRKFKTLLAANGKSMQNAITDHIRRVIEKADAGKADAGKSVKKS